MSWGNATSYVTSLWKLTTRISMHTRFVAIIFVYILSCLQRTTGYYEQTIYYLSNNFEKKISKKISLGYYHQTHVGTTLLLSCVGYISEPGCVVFWFFYYLYLFESAGGVSRMFTVPTSNVHERYAWDRQKRYWNPWCRCSDYEHAARVYVQR